MNPETTDSEQVGDIPLTAPSAYSEALCEIDPWEFRHHEDPVTAYATAIAAVPTKTKVQADELAELVRRVERAGESDEADEALVVGDVLAARCGS